MGMNLIKEQYRKPVLFHEILEASVYNNDDAHEIARKYDDKYAKEVLDSETYGDYCRFRIRWENVGLKLVNKFNSEH